MQRGRSRFEANTLLEAPVRTLEQNLWEQSQGTCYIPYITAYKEDWHSNCTVPASYSGKAGLYCKTGRGKKGAICFPELV